MDRVSESGRAVAAAANRPYLPLMKPCVGIFDADVPTALAFVRSLGKAGVPTRVYSHRRHPVARYSRYCTSFSQCPAVENGDAFVPFLTGLLEKKEIDLVAPTSDLIAFYTAEVFARFPEELQRRLTAPAGVLDCLFKDRFQHACEAGGFATPRAWLPASVDEALAPKDELPYPVLLKPRSHVSVFMDRGVVIRSAEELERNFKPYGIAPGQLRAREKYPRLAWPMIQEYIPNALENLVSVSGVMDERGNANAVAVSRKVSQWPPTLGIGIEFRAADQQELIDRALPIVRSVLARGIFELELLRDPRSGEWLAIDLNPRAHGFISFDLARRKDLPRLWYQSVIGERPEVEEAPERDVVWTHSVPWHVSHWARVLRGPNRPKRLLDYLARLTERSVDIVNDLSDPLPTVPFFAEMVRHPGGLLRPFLTEPLPER